MRCLRHAQAPVHAFRSLNFSMADLEESELEEGELEGELGPGKQGGERWIGGPVTR